MRRMYSENQIRAIIAGASNEVIEALEGQDVSLNDLSLEGDLAVTGSITGSEIVENMTGYSFTKQTSEKGTITYIYVGACKNGNKLTLVNAYIFNKAIGATGGLATGRFLIPDDVMAKIYPFIGDNAVEVKITLAFKNTTSYKEVRTSFAKYDVHSLYSMLSEVGGLDDETDYYIRQEITLLLSDNLAA